MFINFLLSHPPIPSPLSPSSFSSPYYPPPSSLSLSPLSSLLSSPVYSDTTTWRDGWVSMSAESLVKKKECFNSQAIITFIIQPAISLIPRTQYGNEADTIVTIDSRQMRLFVLTCLNSYTLVARLGWQLTTAQAGACSPLSSHTHLPRPARTFPMKGSSLHHPDCAVEPVLGSNPGHLCLLQAASS